MSSLPESAQLHSIGRLGKTHGFLGEVTLVLDVKVQDLFFDQKFLWLLPEGESLSPIPFQIEKLTKRNNDKLIVKFLDIDNPEQVDEIRGWEVYSTIAGLEDEESNGESELIGFNVQQQDGKPIGRIEKVVNYSGNNVFEIEHTSGKVIMVPGDDSLILEIDPENSNIKLNIPEGMLEVYLDE